VLAVTLRVQVIEMEAGIVGLRDCAIRMRVPKASPGGLGDDPTVKVADPFIYIFFVTVAGRKSYRSSAINNGDYFSFLTVPSLILDMLVRMLWCVPCPFIVCLVAWGPWCSSSCF